MIPAIPDFYPAAFKKSRGKPGFTMIRKASASLPKFRKTFSGFREWAGQHIDPPVIPVIIRVEDDIRPVRIFKPLLRLKGLAEDIAVDHTRPEILDHRVDIRPQDGIAVVFIQFHKNRGLFLDQPVFLVFPGVRARRTRQGAG